MVRLAQGRLLAVMLALFERLLLLMSRSIVNPLPGS